MIRPNAPYYPNPYAQPRAYAPADKTGEVVVGTSLHVAAGGAVGAVAGAVIGGAKGAAWGAGIGSALAQGFMQLLLRMADGSPANGAALSLAIGGGALGAAALAGLAWGAAAFAWTAVLLPTALGAAAYAATYRT